MIIDLEVKVEITKKNFTAIGTMIESGGLFFYDMYSVNDKKINIAPSDKIVGVMVRSEMKDKMLLFVSESDKFQQGGKLNVVVKENSISVSFDGENILSKEIDQQMLRKKYKERNLSKNVLEDMFKNFFGPSKEGFLNFKDDKNIMYFYFITALVFICLSLVLLWLKDGKKLKPLTVIIIVFLLAFVGIFIAKFHDMV